MDPAAQHSKYHEIKSAFADIITERRDAILSGASVDDTVAYLRQQGYEWISSVAIPIDRGHHKWNDAFMEALKQRVICEQLLANGVGADEIIDLLRGQGYSRAEVAAFFEGLVGIASGRAGAIVASHFEHSSAQA